MQLCRRNLTKGLLWLALIFVFSVVPAKAQVQVLPSANQQSHHWVKVIWNPNSPTDNVTGYNVYRSTTNGSGYVKQTATPVPNPVYRDDSVSSGTTYYYVVTAVNSAGEGPESSQSTAMVP